MFVSLLAFISLVWLKDQLTTGAGPEWLAADHQEAQRQAEPPQNNRTDEERQKLISQAHIDMRRRQRTTERVNLSEKNKKIRLEMEVSIILFVAFHVRISLWRLYTVLNCIQLHCASWSTSLHMHMHICI